MKTKIAVGAAGALVLLLVAGRVVAVTGTARRSAAEAPRPPLVPAARVTRSEVSERVVLSGSIRARHAVEIHPDLPGRIGAVHAKVGDRVRVGQLLAAVEHEEIAWQAKAARAAVAIARANLVGAKLEHARTTALHEGGAVAPAQLDAAKVRLALAEAQLAQAEAAAGLAEEQVRNARIASPIAGVVTRRPIDVGAQVGRETAAFVVEDLSALKLESAADAVDWAQLAIGATAEVSVDARPGEGFLGKVTVRSPSLDPATRRAPVEIEVENASGKLLPGMFARVTVVAGRVEGVLVAPRGAVVEGPGGAVVWRIAGGKAEAVRPRLGASDGQRCQGEIDDPSRIRASHAGIPGAPNPLPVMVDRQRHFVTCPPIPRNHWGRGRHAPCSKRMHGSPFRNPEERARDDARVPGPARRGCACRAAHGGCPVTGERRSGPDRPAGGNAGGAGLSRGAARPRRGPRGRVAVPGPLDRGRETGMSQAVMSYPAQSRARARPGAGGAGDRALSPSATARHTFSSRSWRAFTA